MADLRFWVAMDADGMAVASFQASQQYVDAYDEQVAGREDRVTPPWYAEGVTFVDVTDRDPRPSDGWHRAANGVWSDWTAHLGVSPAPVVGDGTTPSIVTFTQKGDMAPTEVVFSVNGVESEPVVLNASGVASIEVVSDNPGDALEISVGGLSAYVPVMGA